MGLKRYRAGAGVGKEGERDKCFQFIAPGAPVSLRARLRTHVLARELTLEGRGCLLYKLKVKLILVHVG